MIYKSKWSQKYIDSSQISVLDQFTKTQTLKNDCAMNFADFTNKGIR